MHLYFITRGVKQQRDLFVNFMQTQMFPWKRKNMKTKKDELIAVQGALRPVELWEYVFPEECYDEVMSMLFDDSEDVHMDGTAFFHYKPSGAKMAMLRRAIGKDVKPLPKFKRTPNNRFIEKRGVGILPIGIKKDERREFKEVGYEQEML